MCDGRGSGTGWEGGRSFTRGEVTGGGEGAGASHSVTQCLASHTHHRTCMQEDKERGRGRGEVVSGGSSRRGSEMRGDRGVLTEGKKRERIV